MKYVLLTVGSLSLMLGIIGIFIPVLPTTPFIIMASVCFYKSDKRLYEYIRKIKFFKVYIDNYENETGVDLKTKVTSILFLWISISISILVVKKILVVILLIFIAFLVTIHIIKLKSRERIEEYETIKEHQTKGNY